MKSIKSEIQQCIHSNIKIDMKEKIENNTRLSKIDYGIRPIIWLWINIQTKINAALPYKNAIAQVHLDKIDIQIITGKL